MATRRTFPQYTLGREAVTLFGKFQFSGSGGVSGVMPNFTGSGFSACYLSGTTYTLVFENAWPQLVGVQGQLALSPTYAGTASGTLDVLFNGNQLNQLGTLYSGSTQASTGSGQSQTLESELQQGLT